MLFGYLAIFISKHNLTEITRLCHKDIHVKFVFLILLVSILSSFGVVAVLLLLYNLKSLLRRTHSAEVSRQFSFFFFHFICQISEQWKRMCCVVQTIVNDDLFENSKRMPVAVKFLPLEQTTTENQTSFFVCTKTTDLHPSFYSVLSIICLL